MNKSEYDKYYQKGGSYVIPVEIFNDICDQIERLNKARKIDIEYNKYLQKEIIRLNNIINELEKWLVEWREMLDCPDFYEYGIKNCINDTLTKLQVLKGSD